MERKRGGLTLAAKAEGGFRDGEEAGAFDIIAATGAFTVGALLDA
jgi:hypothetical protein